MNSASRNVTDVENSLRKDFEIYKSANVAVRMYIFRRLY